MQPHLLAKSLIPNRVPLTLEQHLKDTEKAALAIFRDRMLRNWCRFFKVQDYDEFLIHIRVAALFHDIGKANEEFDALIKGKNLKQALRHEWISALILHFPTVRTWLKPSGLDLEVVTAAVLCHHLQASPYQKGNVKPFGKSRTLIQEIQLYLEHPQIEVILAKIGELVNLKGTPELPKKWISTDQLWAKVYENVRDAADDLNYEIEDNPERRALLLAVKSGLIAADSVASGIFRVQSSDAINQWVTETLHREPVTAEEIDNKILKPRYQQIEQKTGKPFELKKFQEKATELNSRLLLLSGCGTGKTIFAYKWQQGVLKHYEVGHVIFLYPTRGTATEGFKDYVSWCPESDASLLTGTATYELKAMSENPSESTRGKDFTTDERLYALGFWGKRFFSATVDQFLSFLTHGYTGLVLLPVLADSVVVIDEVHSFSRKMFNSLISFLEHFDIPVLCMTATLSTSRKKALTLHLEQKHKGLGLFVFPTEDRSELKELEEAENRPRYIIYFCDQNTANTKAISAFQQGKRVLWVVNTVDRCRQKAIELENILGKDAKILTYHSRFTLEHRKERHQETVNAFQSQKESVIAVTTQVCEMSLDLDADVLITELAPTSALVQRFGRSNRHGLIDYSDIWIYEPEDVKPYNKEELKNAKDFINDVLGIASQKQLAEKLEKHSPLEQNIEGYSRFIEAGYWATSEPFRETDDYLVNAVLDTDIKDFLKLRDAKHPDAEGYILPIPQKLAQFNTKNRPDELPKYLEIADSKLYCKKRGFGQ
jgi:CRISPR-associated endonuclease/helicase Cas3